MKCFDSPRVEHPPRDSYEEVATAVKVLDPFFHVLDLDVWAMDMRCVGQTHGHSNKCKLSDHRLTRTDLCDHIEVTRRCQHNYASHRIRKSNLGIYKVA